MKYTCNVFKALFATIIYFSFYAISTYRTDKKKTAKHIISAANQQENRLARVRETTAPSY